MAASPTSNMEGLVGEVTVDLAAGYTGRIGRVAVFLAPTASWGEVRNGRDGSGYVTRSTAIRDVSVAFGFSLAFQ